MSCYYASLLACLDVGSGRSLRLAGGHTHGHCHSLLTASAKPTMLHRSRSALHRTWEELMDKRLPRLHRRFQRLLQVRCCAHVDTCRPGPAWSDCLPACLPVPTDVNLPQTGATGAFSCKSHKLAVTSGLARPGLARPGPAWSDCLPACLPAPRDVNLPQTGAFSCKSHQFAVTSGLALRNALCRFVLSFARTRKGIITKRTTKRKFRTSP